jgi:palmitoyl-protein thioesterase
MYLASNYFLTSINNEVPSARNKTYAHNLATLDTLVLVMFDQDQTVVPKESAWFASEAVTEDRSWPRLDAFYLKTEQTPLTSRKPLVPMHLQPLYIEDWIGLRALDEKGAVVLETCEGEHMQISSCWEGLVREFVGGPM